jgi:hypothetical protein
MKELREQLCLKIGADPNSKAWVRWCEFIGESGVKKAITAANSGTFWHRKFIAKVEDVRSTIYEIALMVQVLLSALAFSLAFPSFC